MAEWLFDFYKRSKPLERAIIVIFCIFLVLLALYVGKYGIASMK